MEQKDLESYLIAGKILKKALEDAKKSIKPGQKLLDIAEKIEKQIKEAAATTGDGAKPAFPVNLSIDNNAAHFSPSAEDDLLLSETAVLKVDAGVQVNGFIADAAFTIDFSGKQTKMVEATEKALQAALEKVKVGARIGEIGKTIEATIHAAGYNPIQNLSGHTLGKFDVHAEPEIPNIEKKDSRVLQEGTAFAIEPFATNGEGFVREATQSEIFGLAEPKPVRNQIARKVLDFVVKEYDNLPFAERWIAAGLKLSEFQRKIALRELLQTKCIRAYPILREAPGTIVTQTETTVVLNKKEVIILV
jgi:methionyl aminopeptidase